MKTSEQIDKLAEALAAAQGEFTNPERNREVRVATKNGGEYSFAYSTLDCVMDMARPILAKHGLSITQPPTVRNGEVVVLTRLMHASGQWQEEEIPVRPESFGPQQIGSAITYLKRYAYCGMLGIAPDEDDDGNGASGNEIQGAKSQAKPKLPPCPECHKNATIASQFDEPGTLFCFPKKGGCGHKWLSVKALADKTGMTTGDKMTPKSGNVELTAAEREAYGAYSRWFASVWTDEAYRAVMERLSAETSQALKSQLEIARADAERRTQLATLESLDEDTLGEVLLWVDKTPVLKDLEKFCGWALNAEPSPFNDEQKRKLLRALERQQQKHAQTAGSR